MMAMSTFQQSAMRPHPFAAGLTSAILPLFTATIFLSALLLFSVEPMFTKMALPLLGGSPSVWSVAMVFFQTLMLAGYSYAYALMRWAPPRLGVIVHIVVLTASFAFLPIVPHFANAPPGAANPTLWLILVFGASVGLPFFALSAQGPMLQSWFARAGHSQSSDPYFLYAASNAGSCIALLAYPFLVEPLLGLSAQSALVTILFVVMAALVVLSSVAGLRGAAVSPVERAASETTRLSAKPIGARQVLVWVARSFVPSGLLVSVTAHISTDIASAPLLWVLPMGLYLLTFVLAFRSRCFASDATLGVLAAWSGAMALMTLGMASGSMIGLAVHLTAFFCIAMMCHRMLYRSRPDAGALTLFYFSMSLGGALGGLFAGLIAPLIFSVVAEYPLLIVAALACRPGALGLLRATSPRAVLSLFGAIAAIFLAAHAALAVTGSPEIATRIAFGGLGATAFLIWRRAGALLIVALAMALQLTWLPGFEKGIENYRSFFGVNRVKETGDGQFRVLIHGTTLHGAIRIRNADGSPFIGRPIPATYYHPNGPLGETIAAARTTHDGLRHIAVIGLGAGALACDTRAGEPATFYEIDPVVVRLASDASRFRYLADCAPGAKIIIGDARLTLASQSQTSDVMIIDAFSSDAIPVHLLTTEAIALYMSKLDEHGLLALHISNNHMEFASLIARSAADLGLLAYVRRDTNVSPRDPDMRTASAVIVLARREADFGPLLRDNEWRKTLPDPAVGAWTDDRSSILAAIVAKWRQ
jgi:hypothetical protein